MTESGQLQFPCSACGAALEYQPGTLELTCPYCGHQQAVAAGPRVPGKHDFAAYCTSGPTPVASLPAYTVRCDGCGSSTERLALSDRCLHCSAPIVATDTFEGRLRTPDAALPFSVDKAAAQQHFATWTGSRWFAPSGLKQIARAQALGGTYLPHWGFDDDTTSDYTGQRGEHYYVTEHYTTTENGRTVTKTRQVRHTRWHPASGRVERRFVDVLAPGTTAVPQQDLERLGPWSTDRALPYSPALLAGFDTPRYDRDAATDGWADAHQEMAVVIEQDCRADIGGDEQRVDHVTTYDANVLFRLLLLPLWIATYVYAGTSYRVYVNANTGEVVGDRPYSKVKIALATLTVLLLALVAYLLYDRRGATGS